MKIESDVLRTELALLGPGARIEDRGDHLFVEVPDQPSFFFGNLLVFERGPAPGDAARWPALFGEAFAHRPGVRHVTLAWQQAAPDDRGRDALVAAGFEHHSHVGMIAREVRVRETRIAKLAIREIVSDQDWEHAAQHELRLNPRPEHFKDYAAFVAGRFRALRRLAQEGRGAWYGAFAEEQLVSALGLFRVGELARYQNVGTHPEFRRLGIAGALIAEAARRTLSRPGVERLVMVSEDSGGAFDLYRALGFEPAERRFALCRASGAA